MSVMFLPAPMTPVHPSLTLSPWASYACACVHLLAAWLLQQRSVWRQRLPSWSSSIHFECCGKTCYESLEVRSHLWCYAERATLAPYCATNQLQDLPSRAQLSGGYWSSLPIRVLQPGELRGWKASSSFCCSISSGRASIPPGTLWSTRLLSCGATSVESTFLGCTKLWDWTGHFQKEAKNFFYAAVTHSASEVSKHQRRFTSVWYYYYYYPNYVQNFSGYELVYVYILYSMYLVKYV